jgi:hypothetical protein
MEATEGHPPSTCGQGLAAHSVLPAKLAELVAAMAENLELHLEALDLTDEDALREHRVYLKLAEELRTSAAQLAAIGDQMAGQRDLPMGRHDERVMSSLEVIAAFDRFIATQQELADLLQSGMPDGHRDPEPPRAGG